ncbi:S-adenosyl-L-methionine-dependent methyltransferase [Canariomyces notabilis]|uniref:DNA (cytosine-5-)-methyltransferase n=1 Tax=Canariomyces notabilis TaxID=2074819 RepID=A0AAN6YYK5_9PEZI|nr:S-adenosyl-L-methionine-dependent methyltransferase [Canariomyces arenarius]
MESAKRRSLAGTLSNPLIVDDDDDGVEDYSTRIRRVREEAGDAREFENWLAQRDLHRDESQSVQSTPSSDNDRADVIENFIEDFLGDDIAEIIDLTGDDDPISNANLPLPRAQVVGTEIPSLTLDSGLRLRPGTTVELEQPLGRFRITFLRIERLLQPESSSEVQIWGYGYSRTRQLNGMLPCRLNELVQIAEISNSDPRPSKEQALVNAPVGLVKSIRQLRVTNAPFPEHRFDATDYAEMGKAWIEQHGHLVCRYRYLVHYNGDCPKPCEWALERVDQRDADMEYRMEDEHVLNCWRGGKIPGGSHNPQGPGRPALNAEGSQSPGSARPLMLFPGQKYTAGDVFAGAGGASRGIERAGVKLLFAVDHWANAVESLESNFPDSRIYQMEVTDFIQDKDIHHNVDMLHLSPPCQFWSPAHTVAGRNDDDNIAVLFSCTDLINKFRPRLFTLEQTFGILSPKFSNYFNMLMDGFTRHGYSVRWKVTPLANYGVPQKRRRLLMVGSAPGEKLPPLPPPTHSKNGTGGLKPWMTPKAALAPLERMFRDGRNHHHALHQPDRCRQWNPPKPPWDPNRLAKTITCNGGQNYHWSGKRDFTLLEYAVLQGFPTWHRFRGSYIKKQIGNAFAPSVVRVFYEHLVRWLLEQDGFDPAAVVRGRGNLPPPGVIDLDVEDRRDGDNHAGGQQREAGREEVVYLGKRKRRSSSAFPLGRRRPRSDEPEEDDDARSDRSETLRAEDDFAQDDRPALDYANVVDLTGDSGDDINQAALGGGSADNP